MKRSIRSMKRPTLKATRTLDRVIGTLEASMGREPVATAVAIGLIAGGATGKFSGFLVGVIAAAVVARIGGTTMPIPATEADLPD